MAALAIKFRVHQHLVEVVMALSSSNKIGTLYTFEPPYKIYYGGG